MQSLRGQNVANPIPNLSKSGSFSLELSGGEGRPRFCWTGTITYCSCCWLKVSRAALILNVPQWVLLAFWSSRIAWHNCYNDRAHWQQLCRVCINLRGRIRGHILVGLHHRSLQHRKPNLGPNCDWFDPRGVGLHFWSSLRGTFESCCDRCLWFSWSNIMAKGDSILPFANYRWFRCRLGMLRGISASNGSFTCCAISILGRSVLGSCIHCNALLRSSQCNHLQEMFFSTLGAAWCPPVQCKSAIWFSVFGMHRCAYLLFRFVSWKSNSLCDLDRTFNVTRAPFCIPCHLSPAWLVSVLPCNMQQSSVSLLFNRLFVWEWKPVSRQLSGIDNMLSSLAPTKGMQSLVSEVPDPWFGVE